MNLDSTTRVVRWCFSRGRHFITCGIEIRDNTFNVLTLPHWDPVAACIERFSGAADALQRHAAIARELRESGWQLAAYTD